MFLRGLTGKVGSNGGFIQLTATESLAVKDGGLIDSSTIGSGNGGIITIDTKHMLVSGIQDNKAARVVSQALRPNSGESGEIQINTNTLEVTDGAEIAVSTFGEKRAGKLTVEAKSIVLDGGKHPEFGAGFFADTRSSGHAGDIEIITDSLKIKDGAVIAASTFGSGSAGNININADRILLSNLKMPELLTGLSSRTLGNGPGGKIKLTQKSNSPYFEIRDGAMIDASTFGLGDAGSIEIDFPSGKVHLEGGLIRASTTSAGKGGDLNINSNFLLLSDKSIIETRSKDLKNGGEAGNMRINAGKIFESRNSNVSTQTIDADGGNISLIAKDKIHLIQSNISTSVAGGIGDGGNINIDPVFVILDGASTITANAHGGSGGNINISTDFFFGSPDNITASSEKGIAGTVNIDSPDTDISSGLLTLPDNFIDATTVLRKPCVQQSGVDVIRLVVRKYQVLPQSPYALWDHVPDTILDQAQINTSQVEDSSYRMRTGLHQIDKDCSGNE